MSTKLENLYVKLEREHDEGLIGIISIDDSGIEIIPCSTKCPKWKDNECDFEACNIHLTLDELSLLSSIACIYSSLSSREIILTSDVYIKKGEDLHDALNTKYTNLKSIREMSSEEFNEMMKPYDGRIKR